MTLLTQRLGIPRYEADEHYKRALAAFQKGDYDQAVDQMNKAINLLSSNPEYYAMRGLIYLQDAVPEKAEADFTEALRRYRYEMLAHYGLGVLAYRAKKWADAHEHFTQALAVQPERPELLYYQALTQHRMGKNDAALALMRQAAAHYDTANDRAHRADANKWVKVFEDLVTDSLKP